MCLKRPRHACSDPSFPSSTAQLPRPAQLPLLPQCAPSEDELKLLRSFLEAGGQPEVLADAEKFAYELGQVGASTCKAALWRRRSCDVQSCLRVEPKTSSMRLVPSIASSNHVCLPFPWAQVPRLAPRLRCLLFQHEAPGQLQDAVISLDCHLAAQRELRASETFAAVLRRTLVLG